MSLGGSSWRSDRGIGPVGLLAWERPRLAARGLLKRNPAMQQDSLGGANTPAPPAALTPLRMTIVGALLIAVGPLSMSLYTAAMTLLLPALHATGHAVRPTITVHLFGFSIAQLICGPLS